MMSGLDAGNFTIEWYSENISSYHP